MAVVVVTVMGYSFSGHMSPVWPTSTFWEQSCLGTNCWQGWALCLQSSEDARAKQGEQKPPSLPHPGSPAVAAAPVNGSALL